MFESFKPYVERINNLIEKRYSENGPLSEPLKVATSSSTKRLRAVLAYLGCGVVGNEISEADNIALAYELITAAYILIDDSQSFDEGNLRGGNPTLRRLYGENIPILTSLLLQMEPLKLLRNPGLRAVLYKSASDTIIGEYKDQELSKMPVDYVESEEHIIEIARMKTASLLKGAIISGAFVGGGKIDHLLALGEYAEDMGTAYQLADHGIDIVGDEKVTGKDTFSDVKTRKKSLVINHALSVLQNGSDMETLIGAMGKDLSYDEKKEVKRILVKSGSIEHTHSTVLRFNERARKHLLGLEPSEYVDLLVQVPDSYTAVLEDAIYSHSNL